MDTMHDWTFVDVTFDWRNARAGLTFEDCHGQHRTLTAEKVRWLEIPRAEAWGPSISVYQTETGPGPGGVDLLVQIDMQSGDTIRLWAASVTLT